VRRESGAGFKLDQAYDRVGQLLKQSAGIAIKPGIAGAAAAQKAGSTDHFTPAPQTAVS
jgi:hypothetical protein